MKELHKIYLYRYFIYSYIKRELTSRYANTLLGISWIIFMPLIQVVLYTIVFINFIGIKNTELINGYQYSIFICSGILPWGLHVEILSKSCTMFIDNKNIIKKQIFPVNFIPYLIIVLSFINFTFIFIIFLIIKFIFDKINFDNYFYILLLLFIQIIFTTSLGTIIGILNVYFRDINIAINLIIQMWFWMTPIVYSIETIPDKLKWVISLNPLTNIILSYQSIIVWNKSIVMVDLIIPICYTIIISVLSIIIFKTNINFVKDQL